MKSMTVLVTLAALAVAKASWAPAVWAGHGSALGYAGAWAHGADDGQWRGEGLAESQDNAAWRWAAHGQDGQWRGEGIAESQDHGQWNGAPAWNVAPAWNGVATAWAAPGHDGQWRGEGLAESQDHGQWNGAGVWNGVGAWNGVGSAWGVYGAGHGPVHETPEVAAARAAHLAAHAAAAHGAVAHGHRWRRSAVLAAPIAYSPLSHVATVSHVSHVAPVVSVAHPLVRSHLVAAPLVHHW